MQERHSLVEPLAVGQTIEVEQADDPRMGLYESSVVALTPESVTIALPVRRGEPLALPRGATIRIGYQGQVSKYAFETVVREVGAEALIVDMPGSVDIAARRADRVSLNGLPVSVTRIEHGGDELPGVGIDVSAWGMRVALPTPLAQWERVRAVVTLPDGPLAVDAQVVRIETLGPSEVAHGLYYPHLKSEELMRLRLLGG